MTMNSFSTKTIIGTMAVLLLTSLGASATVQMNIDSSSVSYQIESSESHTATPVLGVDNTDLNNAEYNYTVSTDSGSWTTTGSDTLGDITAGSTVDLPITYDTTASSGVLYTIDVAVQGTDADTGERVEQTTTFSQELKQAPNVINAIQNGSTVSITSETFETEFENPNPEALYLYHTVEISDGTNTVSSPDDFKFMSQESTGTKSYTLDTSQLDATASEWTVTYNNTDFSSNSAGDYPLFDTFTRTVEPERTLSVIEAQDREVSEKSSYTANMGFKHNYPSDLSNVDYSYTVTDYSGSQIDSGSNTVGTVAPATQESVDITFSDNGAKQYSVELTVTGETSDGTTVTNTQTEKITIKKPPVVLNTVQDGSTVSINSETFPAEFKNPNLASGFLYVNYEVLVTDGTNTVSSSDFLVLGEGETGNKDLSLDTSQLDSTASEWTVKYNNTGFSSNSAGDYPTFDTITKTVNPERSLSITGANESVDQASSYTANMDIVHNYASDLTGVSYDYIVTDNSGTEIDSGTSNIGSLAPSTSEDIGISFDDNGASQYTVEVTATGETSDGTTVTSTKTKTISIRKAPIVLDTIQDGEKVSITSETFPAQFKNPNTGSGSLYVNYRIEVSDGTDTVSASDFVLLDEGETGSKDLTLDTTSLDGSQDWTVTYNNTGFSRNSVGDYPTFDTITKTVTPSLTNENIPAIISASATDTDGDGVVTNNESVTIRSSVENPENVESATTTINGENYTMEEETTSTSSGDTATYSTDYSGDSFDSYTVTVEDTTGGTTSETQNTNLTFETIPSYVVGQEVTGVVESNTDVYQDYFYQDGDVDYTHATWFVTDVDSGEVVKQGNFEDLQEVSGNSGSAGTVPVSYNHSFSETFNEAGEYSYGVVLFSSESEANDVSESSSGDPFSWTWKDYSHTKITEVTEPFYVAAADEPQSPVESLTGFFGGIIDGIVETIAGVFDNGQLEVPSLQSPPEVGN